MFSSVFNNVGAQKPLVHCITNYVTVNDCANALLACGASPIMADDSGEAEEITSICSALDINIGTLNQRTVVSMLIAGKKSNELLHPVVLDPVGAGASSLRTSTSFRLIDDIRFSVIRGNISEIRTIAAGSGTTRGVDADISDSVTEDNLDESIAFIKKLSHGTDAVIAVTGAVDIVADAERAYVIRNGHPLMSKISGTGCILSAVTAAYCGANPAQILEASAAAVSLLGLCGELAYGRMEKEYMGTSTYRTYLIDELSRMDLEKFEGGQKVEIR